MAKPGAEVKSGATEGEWKALLAPMLVTAGCAEDVHAYAVITQNVRGQVELRSNMPDEALRELLLLVMPEVPRD